jgi:hypothetical protein
MLLKIAHDIQRYGTICWAEVRGPVRVAAGFRLRRKLGSVAHAREKIVAQTNPTIDDLHQVCCWQLTVLIAADAAAAFLNEQRLAPHSPRTRFSAQWRDGLRLTLL